MFLEEQDLELLADRLELAGFMHTYDLHDALSAGAIDLKKDYGIAIGYAYNLRRVLSEVIPPLSI